MSQAHRHIVLPSFRDVFSSEAFEPARIEPQCLSIPASYQEDRFLDLEPASILDSRVTYFNVSSERGLWETDPGPLLESTRAKWRSFSRPAAPRSPPSKTRRKKKRVPSPRLDSRAVGTVCDDPIVMDDTPDLATPPPEDLLAPYHAESSSSPQSSSPFIPSYSLPPSSPPSSPLSMIFSEGPDEFRSVSPFSDGMDLERELETEPTTASKVEELDDVHSSLVEPDFIPDLGHLMGSKSASSPSSQCAEGLDTAAGAYILPELDPQPGSCSPSDVQSGVIPSAPAVPLTGAQLSTDAHLIAHTPAISPITSDVPCIPFKRPALDDPHTVTSRKKPKTATPPSVAANHKKLNSTGTSRRVTGVQVSVRKISAESLAAGASNKSTPPVSRRDTSQSPASPSVTTTPGTSLSTCSLPSSSSSAVPYVPSTSKCTVPLSSPEATLPIQPAPVKKSRSRSRKSKAPLEEEEAIIQIEDAGTTRPQPPKATKGKVTRKRTKRPVHDEDDEAEDEKNSPPAAPLPPLPADVDPELLGMLIETLATSRASSLTLSAAVKSMLSTRPALREQRSDQEWSSVLLAALEAGNGGVFGKVESSGKDACDRPLEARWFYSPECDADQERAELIRSMMPRPSKRSVTKRYKQYYYQPLGKLSRWAGEDEL